MESWQTAVTVLLAVLVGAALPVLVQTWAAVRSARVVLERNSERLDRALEALSATAVRVDRVAARLEDGRRLEHFVDALTALSESVNQLRDTARVAAALGAALGPAVGAAVRAWRAPHVEGAPAGPAGDGESPSPPEEEGKEVVR